MSLKKACSSSRAALQKACRTRPWLCWVVAAVTSVNASTRLEVGFDFDCLCGVYLGTAQQHVAWQRCSVV